MRLRRVGGSSRSFSAGEKPPTPTSVASIGLTLRRARVQRGLDITNAARQSGVPTSDIGALELGAIAQIGDAIRAVNSLRRYADYLGLPGKDYGLFLLDSWHHLVALPGSPAASGTSRREDPAWGQSFGPVHVGPPTPPYMEATPPQDAYPSDYDDLNESAYQAHRSQDTQGLAMDDIDGYETHSGYAETGSFRNPDVEAPYAPLLDRDPVPTWLREPTVSIDSSPYSYRSEEPAGGYRGRPTGRRRRSGSVTLLRILVALFSLLVVLAAVGLVINEVRPDWLHGLQHPHSTATTAPKTTPPPTTRTVYEESTAAGGPTISVNASDATLAISASGGDSWVQVNSPTGSSLFQGDVNPGQTKKFQIQSGMTVQVGSAAARLAVSVGGKVVGTYTPSVAPATITYQTS